MAVLGCGREGIAMEGIGGYIWNRGFKKCSPVCVLVGSTCYKTQKYSSSQDYNILMIKRLSGWLKFCC